MNVSSRSTMSHQISTMDSDQQEQPDPKIDSSTAHRKQSERNLSKRSNEDDNSFEREHRSVNRKNRYINNSDSRLGSNSTTSHPTVNAINLTSPRPSFPPFRITFGADDTPSELSIIKDIKKKKTKED